MKNKKGLAYFYLKHIILDVSGVPNSFMTNCVTPGSLWPSKTEMWKLWRDVMDFYH